MPFQATRQAGLERIAQFVPRAGREYAKSRNHDFGPRRRDNVSMLSPYLRYRLISERELIEAVLEQHTPAAAEKFIQEVFWRSYWKGWLELRPSVWQEFIAERDAERARTESDRMLEHRLADAEEGSCGIVGFDDWARELVETGYLHNHARMWFASIWIFTLKLPWTLGADFFLRHLVDADPASNTLGWRWVAGIQTPGKTYRASTDNIERFTDGRFTPIRLAETAEPVRDERPPPAGNLSEAERAPSDRPLMLLVHPEDFLAHELIEPDVEIRDIVIAASTGDGWPWGEKAGAFVQAAAADAADRHRHVSGMDGRGIDGRIEPHVLDRFDVDTVSERARRAGVSTVVTPWAPVGPVADALARLRTGLADQGIELLRLRRDWDEQAWPLATKGFFPFRKAIPSLLERAGLGPSGASKA